MTTPKTIVQKFFDGVRWSFFEATVYQALLALHHLFVFRTVSSSLFGTAGTIFASLYLVIALANIGLDHALSSFFSYALQSKKHFTYLIGRQLCIALIIVVLVSFAFLCIQTMLPMPCALIIAGLCIVESIKKTLTSILHLAFLNKQSAFIEISALIFYITTIWVSYYFGIPFSLYLIFTPLLIASTISVLIGSYLVYRLYAQLPNQAPLDQTNLYSRIIYTRAYTWINQVGHLFFSSNFLVPFFAYHYGLSYAGILKLISTLSYSISSIMRKVGGTTASALFASGKHSDEQQKNFFIATNVVHQLLYGIIIFFSINYYKILMETGTWITGSHLVLAYFFLLITLSESLFITYEAFLITHEKAYYIVIFNVSTMAFIYFILNNLRSHAPLITLIALLSVRIVTFAGMYFFSYYRWRIKPSWHIKVIPQSIILVASLLFFIFV